MRRLVVISNRVPVPKGSRPPSGGLATAVLSALESRGGMWFGWSGETAPRSEKRRLERTKAGAVEFVTLPLSKRDYEDYYKGYANRTLWPLLHSRLDKMEYRRRFDEGYFRVNELFAQRLVPLLRKDDLVWVHDYHLFPLGEALRRARCRQPIGFFLHTPFPPFDVLRGLPGFRKLLHALDAYDLVGFHTDVDVAGFKNAVRWGVPGARVARNTIDLGQGTTRLDVFPISIDLEDVAETAERGKAATPGRRLAKSLNQRRLIIGVDRLDYSKGLTDRFRAYERLLSNHPEVRGQVILLQIAQPSRGDVPEYQSMRRALNSVAGEINGRFAEYDWVPIRYLNKGFARATILGFLRIASIGLVTPLRDGMNLVAKEFVASQDPEDPGPLVLSELAGAARELDAALLVNPYDVAGVAEALSQAIGMPLGERKERWSAMMKALRKNDIHRWRQRFVEGLEQVAQHRR